MQPAVVLMMPTCVLVMSACAAGGLADLPCLECGPVQEAIAIIVDAMQAYFTPVRFYSRQAESQPATGRSMQCNA